MAREGVDAGKASHEPPVGPDCASGSHIRGPKMKGAVLNFSYTKIQGIDLIEVHLQNHQMKIFL